MNLEEITERITAFERDHPVAEFECHGWHVWPHIRQRLLFNLLGESMRSRPSGTLRRLVRRTCGLVQHLAESLRPGGLEAPGTAAGGAVIVTYADRAIPRQSRHFHTVVDPVVEALRARGIATAVWEVGAVRRPRWVEASAIIPALRRACRRYQLGNHAPTAAAEPEWFREFARWARSDMGVDVDWGDWEAGIRHIAIRAAVMEEWLRRSNCRALFVDCWYNLESQAAILAARRLGIPSIDVQHGVHGYPYLHWSDIPGGGYEIMPTGYWVWGRHFARTLLTSSPGLAPPERVFVAGNLWLDKWCEPQEEDIRGEIEAAREICRPHARSVLITLQRGVELDALFMQMIAEGPEDWLWLVRPHRQRREALAQLEQRYRSSGQRRINVIDAAERPLCALLSAVDAHVTGYSTCAMEALAFGKPSALVHPNGLMLYPGPVERGAMAHTPTPGEALAFLRQCSSIDESALRESADELLAPHGESASEIERLLRQVGLIDEREALADE
jgi:hypothetical protein